LARRRSLATKDEASTRSLLLTRDDEVRAGADRLDPQVSPHLALVLAVVGEGRVGDPQVEDAVALVADQAQPRVTHDLAVCNIARCR